jgi:2-polyprenyl-3-methyl-5-hydroxy-6-metoxy-1,4-benzoquinol methylase
MRTSPLTTDRTRTTDEKTWWDSWNTSYRTNDSNDPVSSELFERTAALVNGIIGAEPSRLLEIGCGTGTLSRLLNCSRYHGLDLSSAAINIARQKAESIAHTSGASPRTYEVADFHEWPLPPETFEMVVCVDAIAYFYDQQLALQKMAQSLSPSGRLVLTTINPFVYHRIKRTPRSPLKEGSVSHWLSRRELHKLITSAGFKVERSGTIMPRGNRGLLRLINARRVNQAFGPRGEATMKAWKEKVGLGQYRLVVARKDG